MDFRGIVEFIKDIIGYVITLLFLIFVFTFVVAFQPISGNSMYPTLKEEEMVIVSKFMYKLGEPQRNDIVNVVDDLGKSYVKRIIGLPGEKIEYLDNVLYINDNAFKENIIQDNFVTKNFLFEDICSADKCPGGIIPEGKYLLLGDNRSESVDSRTPEFGLRDVKDIKGKIVLKLWPFKEFGRIN